MGQKTLFDLLKAYSGHSLSSNEKLNPTVEKENPFKNDGGFQKALPPSVPTESGFGYKFNQWLQDWGSLVFVPVVAWAIYVQYDLVSAKDDIEKNEKETKKINEKVIELDKAHIGYNKEIEFITRRLDSGDNKFVAIEGVTKHIEIEHAKKNGAVKTR